MESLRITFFTGHAVLDEKCACGILVFCIEIGFKLFIMNTNNSFFSNYKKFSFM